jgi:DNA-binding NtrC family response regulator
MLKILLIDDDESICYGIKRSLSKDFDIFTALSYEDALPFLNNEDIDFIFLDYQLENETGIDVMQKLRAVKKDIPVAFLTAHGTSEVLMDAIRLGAVDFLAKPVDSGKLKEIVEKYAGAPQIDINSDKYTAIKNSVEDIVIAESEEMRDILKNIVVISETRSPVLLTGESGTGKDVLAKLIHRYSPRKNSPFISINCAAIPETLLESELFGHVKGSFTGAATNKQGKFQMADKGTIFLDEIGDMPLQLQAKLLHVLQDGLIQRVGDNTFQKVDIRIISATNKCLETLVEEGGFREDLYYRINAFKMNIPPLRERKGDIWPLSLYYLSRQKDELKKNITAIENTCRDILEASLWRGNVRELKNIMAKAAVMANKNIISYELISSIISGEKPESGDICSYFIAKYPESVLGNSVEELEVTLIRKILAESENHTAAAKKLGISRVTLYDKIKRYGIE